ncbi:hypothetical protein E2C01_055587 [Portunus trituberculatus]|uniref:Uncharacterized protein n=1 Tax=Portunus trituberculatus TaxID=210409 RepID=A0A5B7GY33_PORTR|nr:hypothetical protein [Portunus trituberculatus]
MRIPGLALPQCLCCPSIFVFPATTHESAPQSSSSYLNLTFATAPPPHLLTCSSPLPPHHSATFLCSVSPPAHLQDLPISGGRFSPPLLLPPPPPPPPPPPALVVRISPGRGEVPAGWTARRSTCKLRLIVSTKTR